MVEAVSTAGSPRATATGPAPVTHARTAAGRPKSVAHRAIHGSLWMVGGYATAQLLRLGTNLVLTRLLFPQAFGLMALVNVLTQGLQMFSDIGMAPALIQHRRAPNPTFYNTAWTIQVIRGFILCLAGCALAVPLSEFYRQSFLAPVIMMASFTAVIAGFTSTKIFSESRELRVRRLVALDLVAQIAAVSVMVPLATQWRSVWPLVVGGLVATTTRVLLSQFALPGPINRFCWDRHSAHELYHFGRWIFVSSLFTYLGMQIDKLLLGRLIPLETLGLYSIALALVMIGVGVFEQLANRVLLPAMSHWSRASEEQFRTAVLSSRQFILSAAAIAVANLMLLAPILFELLYDSRYHAAGQITQWLGFGLWLSLLQRTSQASLLAAGESRALAVANAANCFVTVVAAPIGFYLHGLDGFIAGWTFGNLVGAIVANRALAARGISLVRQDAVLTAFFAAFVAAGFALQYQFHEYFATSLPRWLIDVLPSALLTMLAVFPLYLWHGKSVSTFSSAFRRPEPTDNEEDLDEEAAEVIASGHTDAYGGGAQE